MGTNMCFEQGSDSTAQSLRAQDRLTPQTRVLFSVGYMCELISEDNAGEKNVLMCNPQLGHRSSVKAQKVLVAYI
jgi:hypothetical protein